EGGVELLVGREGWRWIRRDAARIAMKETERRFEVVDRRIAGDDDGDTLARLLLNCGEDQRASLDRRAGDLVAMIAGERALEKGGAGSESAELRNQGVVASHSF